MKNKIFQIFGSKSSIDLDVMVFVDKIDDNPSRNLNICENFNNLIKKEFNIDKRVNCNLAILNSGVVSKVYKGTIDEVNNSLYYTYDLHLHIQRYDNQIKRCVERDLQLKYMRTIRVLLSFLSKTKFRKDVKYALKSDIHNKINTLSNIDLSNIYDLGKRNIEFDDYLKIMAFQLGQTLALSKNKELYTKEDIIKMYPDFEYLIKRDIKNSDLNILEKYKSEFCDICKNYNFSSKFEYRI